MSFSLIALLTFVSVSLCVVGVVNLVFDLWFRDRARVTQRLREEFNAEISQRAQASPLFKDLQDANPGDPPDKTTLWTRLQTLLDQAGLPWTVTHLLIASLILPMGAAAGVWLATGSMLLTGAVGLACLPLPLTYASLARRRRLATLCRQLPDAFDVMSRALRAGQTVSAAFQVIANDFPSPIANEFAWCYEQQHLGIAQEVALRDLARRTGIMELQMFVVAMIVHSRTGGNLAELLAKLAVLLRKRAAVQGRVKALTGEGRMQAVVLIALPALVFVAMYILNRDYAQQLIDRPWLIGGCIGSQAIGAAWIHRMIQIDY